MCSITLCLVCLWKNNNNNNKKFKISIRFCCKGLQSVCKNNLKSIIHTEYLYPGDKLFVTKSITTTITITTTLIVISYNHCYAAIEMVLDQNKSRLLLSLCEGKTKQIYHGIFAFNINWVLSIEGLIRPNFNYCFKKNLI